jgi:hypothetical protein
MPMFATMKSHSARRQSPCSMKNIAAVAATPMPIITPSSRFLAPATSA